MEDILDSSAVRFSRADEGHSVSASFLTPLEMSDGGLTMPQARKAAGRELILGAAGAFLVHLLAAATLVLVPFLQPPRQAQEPFLNVYFAAGEGIGCNSSGTGPADEIGSGKYPEQSALEMKPGEKEAAPAPPKVKTMEQTVLPAKSRAKPAARAKTGHTRNAESPLADSRKTATAAGDHASEDAGAGSGGGQGEGTGTVKGAGESPGGPRPGNSSSGTGFSGEFDAASVDKVPQITKKIEPAYPDRARSLGICGKVVVRFLVEPDGSVSKPSIVEAHPKGYFEQSTLEAVRRWRFKPGCFKGRDVATWVILPVQFQLTGQD